MMRHLEYQDKVLQAVDAWLDELVKEKSNYDDARTLAQQNPTTKILLPDFASDAWNNLNKKNYSPRVDGTKRPVPNATLKVPTGGGKTFLALHTVSKIMSKYVGRQNGFILWIVPSKAIYRQILRNLSNKEHPYRQVLDRASGYRTTIMERHTPLNRMDVEDNLCVMPLTLQAVNRKVKESLKFFNERGDVNGFLPAENDHAAHQQLKEHISNLDSYDGFFCKVKETLGNALRIIRPIMVLDEGHKTISKQAHDTLYGFNPRCVIELTATPKGRDDRQPNILVEVTGAELNREGMIKMPLKLETRQNPDWKQTLTIAVNKLKHLQQKANEFQAQSNRIIRPIALIQVERTGNDQRDGRLVHADDVHEQLLKLGFDATDIAIKTASQDDLKEPENQDLLAQTNPIRVIITKQALQEGWDCSFAYVLCSLTASRSSTNMTQLVGRILRQPHATKTGMEELDQCYVFSHHAETGQVLETVKHGLERDGLGDLSIQLVGSENEGITQRTTMQRREQFKDLDIFLPQVNYITDGQVRPLDYESDILSQINWTGFTISEDTFKGIHNDILEQGAQLTLGFDEEGKLGGDKGRDIDESSPLDFVYMTRSMADIISNPFVARDIIAQAHQLITHEQNKGRYMGAILDRLKRQLESYRDSEAEDLFKQKIQEGIIQFRLRLDDRQYEMPKIVEVSLSQSVLHHYDGHSLERSLLTPIFAEGFNAEEKRLALYLDKQEAINWWHRNVAQKEYGIQGWRRHKIYPDFIFAASSKEKIIVLESKGAHLIGNDDTDYKKELLKHLTDNFSIDGTPTTGQLQLKQDDNLVVECYLIPFNDTETQLPKLFS